MGMKKMETPIYSEVKTITQTQIKRVLAFKGGGKQNQKVETGDQFAHLRCNEKTTPAFLLTCREKPVALFTCNDNASGADNSRLARIVSPDRKTKDS